MTIANAPGTGIADDKAIYSYVPEIIRFYLGEEPILNNIPTWRCGQPDELAYVLDRLDELVIKEMRGSGGYGMLIGPQATQAVSSGCSVRFEPRPPTTSRSRHWRCRPARPSSRAGWRRATSISGPSC